MSLHLNQQCQRADTSPSPILPGVPGSDRCGAQRCRRGKHRLLKEPTSPAAVFGAAFLGAVPILALVRVTRQAERAIRSPMTAIYGPIFGPSMARFEIFSKLISVRPKPRLGLGGYGVEPRRLNPLPQFFSIIPQLGFAAPSGRALPPRAARNRRRRG